MKSKPNARLPFPLAAASAMVLAAGSASAVVYHWDGDNDTAGFGTASGAWEAPTNGTATAGWSTDATGTTVILANSITPTDDGAGVGIDSVQVKIRRTLAVGGKLFARLNVVKAP